MPTSIDKYLDPIGLDETVLNIRQIAEGLAADMQNLPYARPNGIYPDMTVGAVIGADETAQWAQRTTTGSGAATVRSVQGASVVWNQMRDVSGFVRDVSRVIAGHIYYFSAISAADADVPSGGFIRWRLYTMSEGTQRVLATLQFTESGAHKVATRFTAAYSATSDGTSGNTEGNLWTYRDVVGGASGALGDMMLIDLTQMFGSSNEPTTVAEFEAMYPEAYYPYSAPTLKPVRIAGISSTDAQGGELDTIEWTAQTLRAAGSVADMLYADHVDVNVGVVDLGTLTWTYRAANAVFYANVGDSMWPFDNSANSIALKCAKYDISTPTGVTTTSMPDKSLARRSNSGSTEIIVADSSYTTVADFVAAVTGAQLFFVLATPTTTPISPALPMSYKVQQGGTESIIVPDGEVSAAPVLTIAEPVNMSTELARIWAAIESLGYTRNAAQLSQPISLTDIGSIDEVQKDTTDVAEIDTTKEVQE